MYEILFYGKVHKINVSDLLGFFFPAVEESFSTQTICCLYMCCGFTLFLTAQNNSSFRGVNPKICACISYKGNEAV